MRRADGRDPPNSIYLFGDHRSNADDLVKWQLGKFLAQDFPSNLHRGLRQIMRPRDSIEVWNSFQVPNNYMLSHLTPR